MTGIIPFAPVVSDAAAVGAGAVCGALCRHHIGKAATERIAKDPSLKCLTGWHTAGINVLGSFILGGVFGTPLIDPAAVAASTSKTAATATAKKKAASVAAASSSIGGLTPRMKLLLGVGFCGSFTTFSTFSVDVVNMMGKGEMAKACSYVLTNNVGGFCAAAAGMMAAKKMFGR